MSKRVFAVLILLSFGACDYVEQKNFKNERADGDYRAAMDDYQAGRLPQAIEGFTKVCRHDPANASARFQLACLLQDSVKDYFGAACSYREYIQQHGSSEKTDLAKDRLADCMKELAKVLAAKYGLNSAADMARELDRLRAELKASEQRATKMEKALAVSKVKIAELEEKAARLAAALREDDAVEKSTTTSATTLKDAKALLDEEDEDAKPVSVSDAKALLVDEDARAAETTSAELNAARTLANDANEDVAKPLEQASDAKAKREAAQMAAKAAADERARREAEIKAKIPDTYVVQEGDTLYKIAIRFYGHSSAWSRIRNANKAIISTDGRVKVGQRLVLPK